MKKTLITAAAAYSTVLSAHASPDFFTSYSAGYMIDAEEALHTIRVGLDNHGVKYFAQVGISNYDENESVYDYYEGAFFDGELKGEIDYLSLSIGAMGTQVFDQNLSAYYGASIGASQFDVTASFEGSTSGPSEAISLEGSDEEWTFYFDVFAGMQYSINEHFAIHGGARYIFNNGFEIGGLDSGTLDDFVLEAGVTLTF
jgi:opacity protein-like surface antigen